MQRETHLFVSPSFGSKSIIYQCATLQEDAWTWIIDPWEVMLPDSLPGFQTILVSHVRNRSDRKKELYADSNWAPGRSDLTCTFV